MCKVCSTIVQGDSTKYLSYELLLLVGFICLLALPVIAQTEIQEEETIPQYLQVSTETPEEELMHQLSDKDIRFLYWLKYPPACKEFMVRLGWKEEFTNPKLYRCD